MLKWSSEIFIGSGIEDRSEKTVRMLNADKAPYMTWLITRSGGDVDQLEIMNAIYLKQPIIRRRLPEIVGLAQSKAEAVLMVHKMTEECVKVTGNADLNAFLDLNLPVTNLKKVRLADLVNMSE